MAWAGTEVVLKAGGGKRSIIIARTKAGRPARSGAADQITIHGKRRLLFKHAGGKFGRDTA